MTEAATPHPRSPRLRSDESRTGLDGAWATRDRLHTLLEAVLSVGGDLDVETVLQRIVESAVILVDAEYGALGVIGDEEQLARFLTVGDDATIEGIGDRPSGRGILGFVVREPHPLRLRDLNTHPNAHGFPPGHPPMRTFLGVPIRTRKKVFGNIYLTEKRGGADFTDEDDALLRTLAAAAGVVIDNARLNDEARHREQWMSAGSELTRNLLAGTHPGQVLSTFAATVRSMASADLVMVVAPVTGAAELVVTAADGDRVEQVLGVVLPAKSTLTKKMYSSGEVFVSPDIRADPQAEGSMIASLGLGPTFMVPLGGPGHIRGILQVANNAGGTEFADSVVRTVARFADHAALALEIAERRWEAELLTVFQDRDRIARDLHDLAIQRLFATGMMLQSATRLITDTEASRRVERAVDDLDETIKVIRTTIFSLKVRDRAGGPGLRAHPRRDGSGCDNPGVRPEPASGRPVGHFGASRHRRQRHRRTAGSPLQHHPTRSRRPGRDLGGNRRGCAAPARHRQRDRDTRQTHATQRLGQHVRTRPRPVRRLHGDAATGRWHDTVVGRAPTREPLNLLALERTATTWTADACDARDRGRRGDRHTGPRRPRSRQKLNSLRDVTRRVAGTRTRPDETARAQRRPRCDGGDQAVGGDAQQPPTDQGACVDGGTQTRRRPMPPVPAPCSALRPRRRDVVRPGPPTGCTTPAVFHSRICPLGPATAVLDPECRDRRRISGACGWCSGLTVPQPPDAPAQFGA